MQLFEDTCDVSTFLESVTSLAAVFCNFVTYGCNSASPSTYISLLGTIIISLIGHNIVFAGGRPLYYLCINYGSYVFAGDRKRRLI